MSVLDPALSIVCPVYNTERYLDECLDSFAQQTLLDIEIVCVDDGSTDGSPALLDKRAAEDPRFRVIHKPNGGVSRARNAGLMAARGEYVVFWDSDDYVELTACEKIVNIAHRDDADIVVFGGYSFPTVGWIDRAMNTHDFLLEDACYTALFGETGSYPLMCNKAYRRSMLMDNGLRFNEQLELGEDHAFQFLAFPCATNVSFCSDPFYHYRCSREGSALDTLYADVLTKVKRHFAVVEYVLDEWDARGLIGGHRTELLLWASEFLADDVRKLSFDDRSALVGRYRALVDGHGLVTPEAEENKRLMRVVRFLGGADLRTPKPLVTVVASACADPERVSDNFLALANQSLQSIELLCVDATGKQEVHDALAAAIASDPRAQLVADETEALALARGRYVLFANLRDSYDWDTLGASLDLLREASSLFVDPELATFRETRDNLRCADLTRYLHMHTNDGTEAYSDGLRPWLQPRDIRHQMLSFSSIYPGNKLWRTDYARAHALDPRDTASVAQALIGVETFCPSTTRLIERGDWSDASTQEVRDYAQALCETLSALRSGLQAKLQEASAPESSAEAPQPADAAEPDATEPVPAAAPEAASAPRTAVPPEEAAAAEAQRAFEYATGLLHDAADALSAVLQDSPDPHDLGRDWANAYLTAGMSFSDLLRDDEAQRAFLQVFAEGLRTERILDEFGAEDFGTTQDYDNACALVEQGVDAYARGHAYDTIDQLQGEINALLDAIDFLEADLKGRAEQIEHLNRSVSFRLGRALTKGPRDTRDKLKALLGR